MLYIKAQLASIIASLEPVYGIIFAIILLHEIPSARTILCGVIILGATSVASNDFSALKHILKRNDLFSCREIGGLPHQ